MNVNSLRREFEELGLGLEASTLAPLEQDATILTLLVPGGEPAIDAWQRLRAAVERTGRWPILCGEADEAVSRLADQFELTAGPPAHFLARVPAGDAKAILSDLKRAEREELVAFYTSQGQSVPDIEEELDEPDDDEAEWPDGPPLRSFTLTSAYDIVEQTPLERCLIALLPTTQPADAFAYLRFGGWNACPSPEYHVALLRDWGRRYGAVPAAITSDVVECHVAARPQTPADARALAREQVQYCEDIVSQGTQSVERLAVELWQSPNWYFWWD
jgi:hypothetical protein